MMLQHIQAQREPAAPMADPSITSHYTKIATESPKPDIAPSLASAQKSPIVPRGFNPRSCNTCRRRKVKCDKQEGGCGNCAKGHTECVYPGPGRAPRRSKTGVAKGSTERETELLKRLRRLEGVVEELSGQVEIETAKATAEPVKIPREETIDTEPANKSCANPVRVVGMDEGSGSTSAWAARMVDIGGGPPRPDMLENEMGKLVIDEGKSRYVSNSFWARFNGEVENIREMFEDFEPGSDDEEEEGTSPLGSAPGSVEADVSDHHSFVMGYSSAYVDLRSLHPLPSQIPFYWETFRENVDPLCKVMHIPTMSKTMKEVKDNLGSLSRSTEALCFAIYFASIVSMTEEEVKSNFACEKSVLLKRYRFATEQALARAGFLHTSEIVTVQAFTLFLVCVRRFDDSKFTWTLVGLLIRIAQSLGLHRDGTNFKLSPFDTEMRRRCWWQVCVLDVRSAEDYGSDPSILEYSFDTRFPLNINDEDLDPQSTEPPKPRTGITEMTFCLIRYEMCHTNRQLSYVPPGEGPCRRSATSRSLADKEEMVRKLHERLESQYLVYCHNAGPLYWVTATVSRLIVAKMGLVIYSPHISAGLPQSIKDRLFIASIEIMEYSQLLENEVSTKKWGWLFHTYVQWHAIAFILGEVCVRPRSEIVERGWRAVDGVFNDWDDAVKSGKNGMLWVPMRRLMAKARKKREADIRGLITPPISNDSMSTTPPLLPTSAAALPSASFGELPVASPAFYDTNLDPIRPLQPGLPLGGTWDGEMGTDFASMGNFLGTGDEQQSQSQLQAQFQQLGHVPNRPWILDDSALQDLDMTGLEGDAYRDGWSDMANYFQADPATDATRGLEFGGGVASWL